MTTPAALPRDAESILKLAAGSMFELFSSMSEGMMPVDRAGHIVRINEPYKRFLPALGFERVDEFVGRPVETTFRTTVAS